MSQIKVKVKIEQIAVDFEKSFDSIDWVKLIKTLIRYKFHPDLIDTIARVYKGDHTYIDFEDGSREKIEISRGIRQGCPISATLFKTNNNKKNK